MEKQLKVSMNAIKMPQDMRSRILQVCESQQKTKPRFIPRKAAAMAAVLALCICLPLAAGAAGNLGFMKDIKNWCGAITGQEYLQATDAIAVSAEVREGSLLVTAQLTAPEERPFLYIEELTISDFKILGKKGFPQKLEEKAGYGTIVDGAAMIQLPLSGLGAGSYTLKITTFTADAKAEQPLPIHGNWECDFTIVP